jgi:alpha-N-arabinofuranosidase
MTNRKLFQLIPRTILVIWLAVGCSTPSTTPGAPTATLAQEPPTSTTPLPAITVLSPQSATGKTLILDLSTPGTIISPYLYGIFFEEYNHSGDGGIYAELIRNRSFKEDDNIIPINWSLVTSNGSRGSMTIDFNQPLNAFNRSLKLQIDQVNGDGRVGISNGGFWGMKLVNGTTYTASFYAKAAKGFSGPLTISLENNSGVVMGQATIPSLTAEWEKYTRTLTVNNPGGITTDNLMVVSATTPGTIWLQVVSLFPPTWKDRANGLRSDIMQLLVDMHPSMCRFPGGSSVEGITLKDHYQWKQTIGDLSQRPGHLGAFGYYASDGLGFHELLQMCEDLGAEPLYDAAAGYSPFTDEVVSANEIQPYIDDVLDAIEYANGDVSTTWGAKRAANGHPAPFNLKYIEVGNEDWMTEQGSRSYTAYRFQMFFDQIKAKYPNIQVISTLPIPSRQVYAQDIHVYRPDLIGAMNEFSHGSSPRIYVGEWSQVDWGNLPEPDQEPRGLEFALVDAAFMTGLEYFSDSIWSSNYSPVLANNNDRHFNWVSIYYDAMTAFGTPSYYAQVMFARYVGDVTVPTSLTGGDGNLYYAASRGSSNNTIYLKVVNNSNHAQDVTIKLEGAASVDSTGRAVVLTSGSRTDGNTFEQPNKVIPVEMSLQGIAQTFVYSFLANSVTVLILNDGGQDNPASSPTTQPAPTTAGNPPTIAPITPSSSATAQPAPTTAGNLPTITLINPSSAVLKGYWKFEEGSGKQVADSSGNVNSGTLQAGAGWTVGKVGNHAVALTGASNSFVTLPNAVVDTRQSFSVATWVKLDALDDFQTAVSIDGNNVSGFFLQWRMDTGKFALATTTEDVPTPSAAFVSAQAAPQLGVWYHLVGIFDGTSIKLYVNGELQGSQPFTAGWSANGATIIGRARYNGRDADFFKGQIDDVRLYQGVLTDQEVVALAEGQLK